MWYWGLTIITNHHNPHIHILYETLLDVTIVGKVVNGVSLQITNFDVSFFRSISKLSKVNSSLPNRLILPQSKKFKSCSKIPSKVLLSFSCNRSIMKKMTNPNRKKVSWTKKKNQFRELRKNQLPDSMVRLLGFVMCNSTLVISQPELPDHHSQHQRWRLCAMLVGHKWRHTTLRWGEGWRILWWQLSYIRTWHWGELKNI